MRPRESRLSNVVVVVVIVQASRLRGGSGPVQDRHSTGKARKPEPRIPRRMPRRRWQGSRPRGRARPPL